MSRTGIQFDVSGLAQRRNVVLRGYIGAMARTVRRGTYEFRDDLRAAVRGAGLGRLANAVRARVYTDRPLQPAGLVYPGSGRARPALGIYSTGGVIRPVRGQYMAIPLPEAGRYVGQGSSRRRVTPSLLAPLLGSKFGFRKLPSGNAVLFARRAQLDRRGRVARPGSRVNKSAPRADIPVFVLVREVQVSRRFSMPALRAQAENKLRAIFAQESAAVVSKVAGNGNR